MANDDDKDKPQPPPPRPPQQQVWVPDQTWDPPPRPRNNVLYELQPPLPAPATIGRGAIANRDAILGKALSIEFLLRALIDREKEARPNAGSLPELETILAVVVDMRAMLLPTVAAPSDASVGAKALSFEGALVNLWNKEHVSILKLGFDALKLGFDATLFFLGLELIEHFGLLNATIMATVIRQKEIPEALKNLAEIMKSIGGSRN
jgi:hypothetical protein